MASAHPASAGRADWQALLLHDARPEAGWGPNAAHPLHRWIELVAAGWGAVEVGRLLVEQQPAGDPFELVGPRM